MSTDINVAVIGQGYVGLPLAIAAVESGFKVIGIDIDEKKISSIKSGKSPIEDISNDVIETALRSGKYNVSTEFKDVSKSQIVLICVPTPLDVNHKPDLRILTSAIESVAKYISAKSLLIIESTIEPGTTRNVLIPILERVSSISLNEIDVAYSPERIDPTNKKWTITNTPKLVAGFTPNAAKRAKDFYSKFITQVDICDSLEVAETAKLLENTFRLVNISFINEIAMFCQKIGIDVNDVIKAASTKPYGFMPFFPSVGVGGHCIPVDPLYLAEAARTVGSPTRFIDLADEINLGMPTYFVGRASEMLGGLKDKKVLVIGVAYKPNVADVRETPVEALISGLKKSGAVVSWQDD
jgi:UDP-N-acetyl-D-glucosamine dehydrogenase